MDGMRPRHGQLTVWTASSVINGMSEAESAVAQTASGSHGSPMIQPGIDSLLLVSRGFGSDVLAFTLRGPWREGVT